MNHWPLPRSCAAKYDLWIGPIAPAAMHMRPACVRPASTCTRVHVCVRVRVRVHVYVHVHAHVHAHVTCELHMVGVEGVITNQRTSQHP